MGQFIHCNFMGAIVLNMTPVTMAYGSVAGQFKGRQVTLTHCRSWAEFAYGADYCYTVSIK